MSLLSLKIVTPEKKLVEETELTSITIPTENGQITLLPGHIPLVSKVVYGEVIAKKTGHEMSFVTTNGFVKLNSTGETLLLVDYAVRSEDLEVAKIEEAKKKAIEAMKDKKSQTDFVIAEAELRKTLIELKVVNKKRQGTRG